MKTATQLRGQGWLQGSSYFGFEGEAFKAATKWQLVGFSG